MKAITYTQYGPPSVLRLQDISKPVPKPDQLLVRVRAAAVNPYDWHFLRGLPYFMRLISGIRAPRRPTLGADFAGEVEAVGSKVTEFRPGDALFGFADGTFAEYVVAKPKQVALKPDGVSFEQAASLPIAGITALQGLRDVGKLQPGQRALIVGASGGVGTFAVPLAKHFGAHVTGVCSTRNLELVRSLGADHVIDYTQEDWTTSPEPYDLVLHLAGRDSPGRCRTVLTPKGSLILSSGDSDNRWLGPLGSVLGALLLSPFVGQKLTMVNAKPRTADLEALAAYVADGTMTPILGESYPLAETAQAMAQIETAHTRGKILITP